jgi:predicted amidophosphoribosyltransferase
VAGAGPSLPLVSFLLDLLLPPVCALCRRAGPLLCGGCLRALPLLAAPVCARCGAPTIVAVDDCRECRGRRLGFARARAAVAYDGAGRALVHAFKDAGLRALAEAGADLVVLCVPPPAAAELTWVPATRWRELRRGYHPPRLLAEALGRRWGMPARPLLDGPAFRRSQRGLGPAERRANVRGAFRARAAAGSLALVDDVYTTGATLAACARALRAAGASSVEAVTLARAVRW